MSKSLLFELLQVALGTRNKLSRVPFEQEWEKLYDDAERQAVVSVMLSGIENLSAEQLPPLELKLQWIGETQMDEAIYKSHCERAAELARQCRAVGFKSCVLKGVGTAQYYPEPSRRQCGDIDLWVNGRRKDVMAWLRSEYKVGPVMWHHIEAEIYDDVSTEIHIHPTWVYNPLHNWRLQQFFERNKNLQMQENRELGFAHPTVQFDAVFSLVHSFHHLLEEGVGLRHIVDYFYILKALPTNGRDEAMQTLNYIGLGKFAVAMMWMMKEVCGMRETDLLCEPNDKEGRFLLSEIMVGGNFGQTRQDGKDRNTFRRWMMMVKHYPGEVLWMVPWKVWHRCWRFMHK